MRNYQQYSTSIKVYYSLGVEKTMIDKTIREQIPYSTSKAWKSYADKPVIGLEFEKDLPKNLKELEVLYHPAVKIPKDVFVACMQLVILLSNVIGKQQFQKTIRNNKDQFINFIEQYSEIFSCDTFAQILNISTKTLYNWKQQVKFKCEASALLKCVKRHPNQATIHEVQIIKERLTNTDFGHWGIHSIWAQAFKEGVTNLSKQAWYHYNKLLVFRKYSKKGRKPPNADPLRAEKMNQIWHADITVFKTLDGIKHYIYTVMDNYSRYILSWRIERIVSAKIRLETIQEAIQNAFNGQSFSDLQLVTDGGPENDNQTLKSFMNLNHASIHHDIALRTIQQSNSMMEAFYHITKYRCLYLQKIRDYDHLFNVFQDWILEYNYKKPHHALGIYTPAEILNGSNKHEKYDGRMNQAGIERRAFNKNANCTAKCH
ncbi:MAG: hypothetical protein A3D31_01135 [Candidatus Fluviicola riflensis]|nr:MAG: hypothetical protein CHH17_04405 [Candidatus Fluviicola riflensis]OGS76210.1 MAG: hypothetical protein A3D31_01135 [Candidatus Fluviicola riflensis]OGS83246.1 MAG: hypothetical protein A2724_00705 [Fluviicola sp. RIFCSPHIGHO2_01_FULL_43_53]OGS83742.1 MAG: hypothetical protein A3E30_17740 [Fluviicola sp. RIFCSPHIGHO2_12_FULL_43_24]